MSYKKIFMGILAVLTVVSLAATAFASNKILRVSVIDADTEEEVEVTDFEDFDEAEIVVDGETLLVEEDAVITEDAEVSEAMLEEDVCGFNVPEEKTYGAQLIAVRRKLRVEPGEEFRVKVFFKNTGSMPWFANKSSCLGPKISLGTDRVRDRASIFYKEGLDGWEGSNRVAMDQYRTDPREIGSFTFWGKAGDRSDVYKEYWTPVAKDLQWMDDGQFSFEVMIGDTGESAADLRKKMAYSTQSGSVSYIDLNAEKSILVDLSDQMVFVKLGDLIIREFPVSTGASATPTPVGETKISLKQEVRVAHKAPHYIMPKYQMFRAGGYGFHSLPSLGRANSGVFWTEARSHIGIPVSHGCIRLLPEDADWLFQFTDIGVKVVVQR